MKSRRTSKENSVEVSVKIPVERTENNWLTEVVQIHREEGKDSLKKKMNTCNERKQPEKVPVKGGKKKHSGSKKSKARKTITKAPNHGQNPVKTQKKALSNRVKRSGNEKEERVVPHAESKRVRLEEEVKPLQSKEVSTEKKEQSTMSEEKKDSDLLFQEVKEVTKSSRLSASSSDKKVATSYRRKFFDFRDYLNFLWWRENKKENAETTLGDSKSVEVWTVDEAVKEKADAKRIEDLSASTEKEMINTHCVKEENSEKVVSEDNEDLMLSGTDKEKKEECDLEEETKTADQKYILCEKKMSSEMSEKELNLATPVEDVDGCTDIRFSIPYGIRNTAYSDFSGFG